MGVGLTPTVGVMFNQDAIIGDLSNNTANITQRDALSYDEPSVDVQQDLIVLDVEVRSDGWFMEFTRPLNTSDSTDLVSASCGVCDDLLDIVFCVVRRI